jgi:TPR repeat protein
MRILLKMMDLICRSYLKRVYYITILIIYHAAIITTSECQESRRMKKLLTFTMSITLLFIFGAGSLFAEEKWRITPKNIEKVKAKAEAGDDYYQAILGDAYEQGEVVLEDDEEAYKWTKLAADQGNPLALYNLGDMYKHGSAYTPRDLKKADKYYKQARKGLLRMAKKGDARAQQNMFYVYRIGNGVETDEEEALKWRRKAVDQGFAEAQWHLGIDSQSTDLPLAVKLLTRASEQEYSWAQSQLAAIYAGDLQEDNRKGVPVDLEKALYWHLRMAKGGHAWGLINLAGMYESGKGVKKDKRKAFRLYYQGLLKIDPDYPNREFYDNRISFWDEDMGLLLPVKIKWAGIDASPIKTETEEKMNRSIEAYKAGMTAASEELFNEALRDDALFLYRDNYWYVFYEKGLPLSRASEILLAIKPKMKTSSAFWFDYAHNANLAGQPALAMVGTSKLKKTTDFDEKDIARWVAILETNALMQLGKEEEAYNRLYKGGQVNPGDTWTVNYINNWAKPLLKDKRKLAFATGIKGANWVGAYEMPRPQAFNDIETGKLIEPVVKTPKLEKKPKPEKKEEPKVKKIKFTVLDG